MPKKNLNWLYRLKKIIASTTLKNYLKSMPDLDHFILKKKNLLLLLIGIKNLLLKTTIKMLLKNSEELKNLKKQEMNKIILALLLQKKPVKEEKNYLRLEISLRLLKNILRPLKEVLMELSITLIEDYHTKS